MPPLMMATTFHKQLYNDYNVQFTTIVLIITMLLNNRMIIAIFCNDFSHTINTQQKAGDLLDQTSQGYVLYTSISYWTYT